MKRRELKDVAASVRQRLLNEARASSRPFNEILQYLAMERFLYRLSVSPQGRRALDAEEDDPGFCRHKPTLMPGKKPERLQILPSQLPHRAKSSEAALKSMASELMAGTGSSS